MISSDVTGLILVYSYVALILIVSEKVLGKYTTFSRKFLHIMVGNVIFILPFFTNQFVITFLAAAPFVVLTFLISPYSPVKINDKISSSGHGMGLVYYAISWTVLAFFFYNQPWIIAVGIAAMSYGDGFAALIGEKYGKHKFKIFSDTKSLEGSFGMFLVLVVSLFIVMIYFNVSIPNLLVIPCVAITATIFEAVTPKGLDNLTACFAAVGVYLLTTTL
jgi:phytol kinase